MRYYLLDQDEEELVIDLQLTKKHSNELFEFELCYLEKNVLKVKESVYTRKLADQYFVSSDNVHWEKVSRQEFPRTLLDKVRSFDLYRGFRPSGLGGTDSGDLLTRMPGKVVKVTVDKGQEVEKGETLIILEAMKMENEIKSGLSGVVKEIHVKEGQVLEQGILMMEVERK